MPRSLIEFKLVKTIGTEVKWEEIAKNHFICLGNQTRVQVRFREGKEDVAVISMEEKKAADSEEKDKFTREVKVTGNETIIIASAELPVDLIRTSNGWTTTRKNKPMYPSIYRSLLSNFKDFKWVGYADVPEDADREVVTAELAKQNCVPVFLSRELVAKFNWYYEKVLYPFCHNFIGPTDDFEQMSSEYWEAFKTVNQKFANVIVRHSGSNPLIWLNDMQLVMCPLQIIRKNVIANIGIFMHTAFPSGEICKIFPYREEILRSMLCCNIIGFHIFSYARNFSIACGRILGTIFGLS